MIVANLDLLSLKFKVIVNSKSELTTCPSGGSIRRIDFSGTLIPKQISVEGRGRLALGRVVGGTRFIQG